ncbi:hotdog fold domain-containing protein [Gordonia sp. SMJS1]|nr:hotdog fold domain-containing protein [Gordonia sp. SMJS1]WGJ84754.1 hotdog fold domain-containing protein [Gordonia sp. SMJS1]
MSQPHDPLSAFHLGDISVSESGVRASQRLCPRFADHRGVIELPALAVLFDHCGGIPFHRIHDDPAAATLQARLTMSTHGRAEVGDLVAARAEVVMHDDAWGSTSVEIRTGTGDLCCVGTARNVRVGVPRPAPPRPPRSVSRHRDAATMTGPSCPSPYPPRCPGGPWSRRSRRRCGNPARSPTCSTAASR